MGSRKEKNAARKKRGVGMSSSQRFRKKCNKEAIILDEKIKAKKMSNAS